MIFRKFKNQAVVESNKRRRKYTFDYAYFKSIDTEQKAYWLGFLYADGNMALNPDGVPHRLKLSLVTEGKQHLEKFARAVSYSGNVLGPYVMKYKYKGEVRESIYHTLELGQEEFVHDLVRQGVVPSKTFLVHIPKLPEHLMRHFIRGVFDGDGTVSKRPSFCICGGEPDFLRAIVDCFVHGVGARKNKVIQRKNKKKKTNTWALAYQGVPALRIRDWMYEGATVWMQCKRDVFFSSNNTKFKASRFYHADGSPKIRKAG